MGDGQHGWAAAEWVMMIRSLFVREEENRLIIGSGIFPEWIESGRPLSFGPTLVPGGRLTVKLEKSRNTILLEIDPEGRPPEMDIFADIPGYESQALVGSSAVLRTESSK
jgi:hypothetical protein